MDPRRARTVTPMEGENLVTPIVVLMGITMVALLFAAARRSSTALRRMTMGVAGAGLLVSLLDGGVPIYEVPCPLCGHGWHVEIPAYLAAVGVAAALAYWTRARRSRTWIGAPAALVLSILVLRAGVRAWFS